jgi:hypothetical protein
MGKTTKNELRRWQLEVVAYDENSMASSVADDKRKPRHKDIFAASKKSAETIAKKVFINEIGKRYQLADYYGISAYSDPIVIGVDVEKSSTSIGGYREIDGATHSEGWNKLHEVKIDRKNWFRYYEGEPWEDPTVKSTKKKKPV